MTETGSSTPSRLSKGLRPLVVALAFLAFGGCEDRSSMSSSPLPDIVLVTLDTLRADALGPYRTEPSVTPRIDQFALESTVFENAITPIGTTFPAHASLFTGLYPRMHGVRWNGDTLAPEHQTLAESLALAGYQTAAFSAVASMLARGGLGQGFQSTFAAADSDTFAQPGSEVSRQALEWLKKAGDERPFFLWTHFFDAHTPYIAGAWAQEQFRQLDYKGPLREGTSVEQFYSLGENSPLTEEANRALRTLYDEEAVLLDGYFGQLLEGLERRQSRRPLIVILTADHGQSLGEHGTFGHGFLLWQPVLHVPLIIGSTAVPNPSPRVSTRVSLLDLHSTILDMAGIEDQASTFSRSLWPALTRGKAVERTLFAEVRVLAKNQTHSPQDAAAVAVFDGSSKLIWRPDGFQFFNLGEDPIEVHGVMETAGDRQREMIRMAETFADDVEAVADWESLDSDALQELRALGYLD